MAGSSDGKMDFTTSNLNFLKPQLSNKDVVDIVFNSGFTGEYIITIKGNTVIPKSHPKLLKDNISLKITQPKKIESIRHTRTGLICSTYDHTTAKELLDIKLLLSIKTSTEINNTNFTSRFVLHNIPTDISLDELKAEIECENNLIVFECRRFTKKSTGGFCPTESVLITVIGTILPP